jgi:hypothetical protein
VEEAVQVRQQRQMPVRQRVFVVPDPGEGLARLVPSGGPGEEFEQRDRVDCVGPEVVHGTQLQRGQSLQSRLSASRLLIIFNRDN